MNLDLDTVRELALAFRPRRYVRAIPKQHNATPLGMGNGRIHFSSPTDAFRLLYLAEGLSTAMAETIVRDRFEGVTDRVLDLSEIDEWSVAETSAATPLTLVDLRTTGLLRLGVSTDAARAKMHGHGQELAAALYAGFDVDGLLYSSRLTGEICVAVFDRAVAKLVAASPVDLRRQPNLIAALKSIGVRINLPA